LISFSNAYRGALCTSGVATAPPRFQRGLLGEAAVAKSTVTCQSLSSGPLPDLAARHLLKISPPCAVTIAQTFAAISFALPSTDMKLLTARGTGFDPNHGPGRKALFSCHSIP
jgi:hypothetical protein